MNKSLFCFFILLLVGTGSFSFFSDVYSDIPEKSSCQQQESIEQKVQTAESELFTPAINEVKINLRQCSPAGFTLHSANFADARKLLPKAPEVVPGLNLKKIIYPFHSFL